MLINIIFIILFFTIIGLLFINKKEVNALRYFSLSSTGVIMVLSSILLLSFNNNINDFQNLVIYQFDSSLLNFSYSFGLDGISIYFFFLTSFLIFLCVLFICNEENLKQYLLMLIIIEFFLLIIFSVLDLMLFYVFFEAILMPMYVLIGFYGSRERKIRAVYLFFFYTLCGSLLFLIGILYIYSKVGTLNLEYLMHWKFNPTEELFLWFAFFLSFASKIPMFPFHIWLPEAHVEAPTVGSVLLAGILLKLGVYGFMRLSLTLFPYASLYYSPLIYFLSIIGTIYASLTALRQTDLKRIIAYSSVAHMNLVTLGIFSFNVIGLEGAIIQSISHGFVSGGMFFLIGIIYNRYHSRFLHYYGGLVHTMPLYSIVFLLFTLANIALPGTSSFTGEFMLLSGIYKTNVVTGILSATGVILSGAYSLWLYNRVVFGNLKEHYTLKFVDLSVREFFVIFPLTLFIFFMGIYPSMFLSYIHLSVINLLSILS
jgi:proton-translocating NADH-quinone oxidoreductase chain M